MGRRGTGQFFNLNVGIQAQRPPQISDTEVELKHREAFVR
jgi:hypothetical protein